jgi:hypothetical protein
VPINILGRSGFPIRNDNITNLAYVGRSDGSTAPEQYIAYHPDNAANTAPIKPGETMVLRNLQTGLFCRLVPIPSGYPLSVPGGRRARGLALPPGAASTFTVAASALPPSCATFGVIADQPTAATAVVLTYNGYGMSYQGVPLVQSPGTATLILSNATGCTQAGGNRLRFVLAPLVSAQPPPPTPPRKAITGAAAWLADACLIASMTGSINAGLPAWTD